MDSVISHSKFMWSVLLSVSLMFIGTLSDVGKITTSQNSFGNTQQNQFTTKNNTRIIVQKGGLAILPCVVKVNSPATVSWIRRKDFQLLTVGLSTHSSDKRFLVEHTRHMGHWSLRIKSVKEEDRGFYECQLSIYPTQSIFVELKIVEAIAEIASGPDMHIDEGSMLRLECKLKRATENPTFVFWYHYSKMVNYDTQGGYTVTSPLNILNIPNIMNTSSKDRNSSLHLNANNGHIGNHLTSSINSYSHSSYLVPASTSILSIKEVHFHHAGNYTCAPSNARPASIMVHVHKGEKPAAMQHANRSIFDSDPNNNTISNNISFSNSGRIANSIWTLRIEFMLIFKFIYFSKSKLNLYVNFPICTFLFIVLHHKIKR